MHCSLPRVHASDSGLPGQVKTNTFHEMVKEYITQRFKHIPAVLHRIDKVARCSAAGFLTHPQPASGIMVYGKNKEAEKYFQRIVQDNHSVVMKVPPPRLVFLALATLGH